MNMLRQFPFLVREGLRNLWANRWMSLSAVGVLGVCLLLISNAVLISKNIDEMVSEIGLPDAIVVYLKDGTTPEEAESFEGELLQLKNVHYAEYTSSEEALAYWKDKLSEYPDIMEGIESGFLPPYYSVTVYELESIDETVYQLEKMELVDSVRQNGEVSSQLVSLRKGINSALYTIVVILFVVAVFIIVNTVKLAMFSRRKEISIMKFVGATDGFIRLPFLVEGFFIGLFAALVAFFVQWYVYGKVIVGMVSAIHFISALPFASFATPLLGAMVAAGALTGMIGSTFSIGKYLRV